MKKINSKVIFLFILFSSKVFAQDNDCAFNYSLESALPKVKLPSLGFTLDTPTSTKFCFDPSKNLELKAEFEELKKANAFDDSNCADPEKSLPENQMKLTRLMLKVMDKGPLSVISLTPKKYLGESSAPMKLIFTNSSKTTDSYLELADDQKLTGKDMLKITGITLGASVVGTLISKEIYKGPGFEDKRKHEKVGALINLTGTGLGYLAFESTGLADKLKLSKRARKCAVTATGGLMLFLAAAGKEAYDKTQPKKHTSDVNDFVATALGGGAGAPFVVSCGFDF